jgi:hypothetical protein
MAPKKSGTTQIISVEIPWSTPGFVRKFLSGIFSDKKKLTDFFTVFHRNATKDARRRKNFFTAEEGGKEFFAERVIASPAAAAKQSIA